MEKLKAAGLYGGGLISLSGALVKRYNQCLAVLGLTPTDLTKFQVDAMGWSPEISEEKTDAYYLNLGEANSNAIIVSPQQEQLPVHMPFHSFDRDLMLAIFAAYRPEIKDITKDSAICIQLDQNIDAYYNPVDLLHYNKIHVNFKLINDLEKKQAEQLELVSQFNEGNNFINRELHKKLLDSARANGDLRKRKLHLDPLQLPVSSFYTCAFGGVFILKDFIKPVMIFESEKTFKEAIKDTSHDVLLFHIDHNELTDTLLHHLIVEIDLRKAARSDRYERIKKHLISSHLANTEHPLNEILASPFLIKKYLNTLDAEIQKQLLSVERYNQRKIVERELKAEDVIAPMYLKALLEPHSALEEEHKTLIYKLICKMMPIDPIHLYWYDKAKFYQKYTHWNENYKDWVIECILDKHKSESV
jgi:hypothetical protein